MCGLWPGRESRDHDNPAVWVRGTIVAIIALLVNGKHLRSVFTG
jgi:hypothetical protein